MDPQVLAKNKAINIQGLERKEQPEGKPMGQQ